MLLVRYFIRSQPHLLQLATRAAPHAYRSGWRLHIKRLILHPSKLRRSNAASDVASFSSRKGKNGLLIASDVSYERGVQWIVCMRHLCVAPVWTELVSFSVRNTWMRIHAHRWSSNTLSMRRCLHKLRVPATSRSHSFLRESTVFRISVHVLMRLCASGGTQSNPVEEPQRSGSSKEKDTNR